MSNRTKGILAILLAALGFSLMNLLIPLAGSLPSIQKSFFRNIVSAMIAIFFLIKANNNEQNASYRKLQHMPWKWLLLRATFGTLGIWFNFYAVDHLLISDAAVLNKISPFATLVFSYIVLKEPMKKFHWVVLAIAFSGLLFVVKPTLSTSDLFPYLMGILGGVSSGAAYTCVRQLNLLRVSPAFTIAFFSVFSCVVSLPQFITGFEPMTINAVVILIGVGLMAAVGQFGITTAYRFAPASEISVFDYANIIFTGIWGYLFLNQLPDGWSLIGYVIIVTAGVLNFQFTNRISKT